MTSSGCSGTASYTRTNQKKYYRSLFYGLMDMVNAFIVQRYHIKISGKTSRTLQISAYASNKDKFEKIEAATIAANRTAASPRTPSTDFAVATGHYLAECLDKQSTSKPTRDGKSRRKRLARTCKDCAVYRINPRKYTKHFCPGDYQGELREGQGNHAFKYGTLSGKMVLLSRPDSVSNIECRTDDQVRSESLDVDG
ncbi:Hypothetical protein PHPALM_14268 [Phytophthora palmivora]|uniref:PiggyBac transposable element-derived protein domain-containing protein n=1 Tax=Phytophthora palmivora TaxID=4796 RepID=A0A2P4XV47_9STRA|nr:Hypothetical protein PHPALM_14268 [Phytophthora palmivora]